MMKGTRAVVYVIRKDSTTLREIEGDFRYCEKALYEIADHYVFGCQVRHLIVVDLTAEIDSLGKNGLELLFNSLKKGVK